MTAASRHDATAEIAQAIARVLQKRGLNVALLAPGEVVSVEGYDAAVIGSAVYTGHWLKPAIELIHRTADGLATRPVWLFSSGPVGDPSRKLVQKMAVDPDDLPELRQLTRAREHRLFAGRLEKQRLTRPQRAALTVFRHLEGDFRDWEAIEQWAAGIADSLTSDHTPSEPERIPVEERSGR